jgi:hypothetical protein
MSAPDARPEGVARDLARTYEAHGDARREAIDAFADWLSEMEERYPRTLPAHFWTRLEELDADEEIPSENRLAALVAKMFQAYLDHRAAGERFLRSLPDPRIT